MSPASSTINDIQKFGGKAINIYEKQKDPLKYVTKDDIIRTSELAAKAIGEFTGLPTPYLVQAEKAIRKGKPKELIFSNYALNKRKPKTKEQIIKNARKNYMQLLLNGQNKKAHDLAQQFYKKYPNMILVSPAQIWSAQKRQIKKQNRSNIK